MNTLPDKDRGIITYIMLAKVSFKEAAKSLTDEEWHDMHLYLNEISHQILDATTRRTGRLTKLLKVFDVNCMSIGKADRTYVKRDGAAVKKTEMFYPQLLGKVFI
eukprot:14003500-Ditylum_brightwellii.AAC.1